MPSNNNISPSSLPGHLSDDDASESNVSPEENSSPSSLSYQALDGESHVRNIEHEEARLVTRLKTRITDLEWHLENNKKLINHYKSRKSNHNVDNNDADEQFCDEVKLDEAISQAVNNVILQNK